MSVRTSHGRPSLREPDRQWKTPAVLKTSRHTSAVSDKAVSAPRAASLERYSCVTARPSSSQLLPSHVRLHETNSHLSDNFIDLTSSSNDNHSHTCTLGSFLSLTANHCLSRDWVLSHWAHFTVCRLIYVCVCILCVFILYICYIIVIRWVDVMGLKPNS